MATEREVTEALTTALGDEAVPNLKDILSEFVRLRKGPKGIARMLNRAYKASKPGSIIQNMILQMVLTAAKNVGDKEAPRDTSILTDEDIDREIRTIMDQANREAQHG